MSKFDEIKFFVGRELKIFEDFFNKSIKSDVPFLSLIINYILRRKGKQLRPLIVLLSSRIVGDINSSVYNAATMIELLHTATLVHDDIVDESFERRSSFSINALWKSKMGVLIGDFLLAKGLLIGIKNKEYKILEIISETVEKMSEGEIQQLKKSRKLNITEDEYFSIISKKTASLISACTSCGVAAITQDSKIISDFKEIGLNLGLAFQIKDDMFSFQKNSSGKPDYNDFKEKKITLPLIHALSVSDQSEAKTVLKILNRKRNSISDYRYIIDFTIRHDGLEYANQIMNSLVLKCKELLSEYDDSVYKTAFIELFDYIITRKK